NRTFLGVRLIKKVSPYYRRQSESTSFLARHRAPSAAMELRCLQRILPCRTVPQCCEPRRVPFPLNPTENGPFLGEGRSKSWYRNQCPLCYSSFVQLFFLRVNEQFLLLERALNRYHIYSLSAIGSPPDKTAQK